MLWKTLPLLLTLTVTVSSLTCFYDKKTSGPVNIVDGDDNCRTGDGFCVLVKSTNQSFEMNGCSMTAENEWAKWQKVNQTVRFCQVGGCWMDKNSSLEICCCDHSFCNNGAGGHGFLIAVMVLLIFGNYY